MSGSLRVVALVVLAIAVVGSIGYAGATTQSDAYEVRASDSIDVPDRSYTFQGAEYTVTSAGKVPMGDVLTAETDGPENADFDVNLYNSDQQIVGGEAGGDGSVSFQTSSLRPGTYVLVVYTSDGSLVAPQPVVVAGYETTLDAPTEITGGESSTVSVDLTDNAGLDDPESVELVVVQDEETVRTVTMRSAGTYEYTAEIGSSLDAGEYGLYAKVRNETMANGEHELVGLSDRVSLSVSAADGGSTTEADSDSSSGSGSNPVGESDDTETEAATTGGAASGSSAGSDGTETSDSSSTATNSDAASPTSSASDVTATPASESTTMETSTASDTATAEPTGTSSGATGDSGAGTSTDSTMPTGALQLVALVLVVAAILGRR